MAEFTLNEAQTAEAMKVLAEPTRLQVVSVLAAGPATQKQLQVDQSVLAYHMRKLCRSGLVSRQQQGVWVMYRIAPEMFAALAAMIRPAGAR